MRIDHVIQSSQYQTLGHVLYVMVEFQILDKETAIQNEEGDSAHRLYKQRQLGQVRVRLRKGGRNKRELSSSTEEPSRNPSRDRGAVVVAHALPASHTVASPLVLGLSGLSFPSNDPLGWMGEHLLTNGS